MPAASWNDSYDDGDDHDDPEPTWDEEDTDTVTCPACGADIYEDSEQCPVCGQYILSQTSAWQGKPLWWIVLGLLGIAAVTIGLLLGF